MYYLGTYLMFKELCNCKIVLLQMILCAAKLSKIMIPFKNTFDNLLFGRLSGVIL